MNLNKYSRQIPLSFVGLTGQKRINETKIAIIGAGALAHSCSIYLAAGGVGEFTFFDQDIVEESNLSRQIFFSEQDIGKSKVKCLIKYLEKIHDKTKFNSIEKFFCKNDESLIPSDYHLIINASDNYLTRKSINLVSLKKNIPWLDMGILKMQGHFCIYNPGCGCYECLFQNIPESTRNCSFSGILSPVCGVIGSYGANEVLKYILNKNQNFINEYIQFDLDKNIFKKFFWKKNKNCILCQNIQSV
ncbi:HesA/MoeB/ThiF family protein [Silvanigrella aquatica]|uniref:THIF-type NAD/FAD binding fold domain-containing protein n=1 Tax=Silvanigrella aquatica TaxID=1915309 RepID=A0A1L4D1B0_9BACT|nr:HesA/MoeB/ThiF family protein [Silvanigrella aquatica]APJ03995.1 hypothetical protein AXG55_08785 [Silvanigrella aquatica]